MRKCLKTFSLALFLLWGSVAIGQTFINNLPAATTPLSGTELTIVQQGGVTKQTAVSNIGGATAPGGANTNVQFNNSGAFAGAADFSWLSASDTLLVGTSAKPGVIQPNTSASNGASLTINSGASSSNTGNSGALNLNGASAGQSATVTAGNGAAVNISAGRGSLNTSTTNNTGTGGSVTIAAGIGAGCFFCTTATGDGGAVSITAAGPDIANGSLGSGGNVTITAGNAAGTGGSPKTAGNVVITAGNSSVGTDTPGIIQIYSGTSGLCGSAEIGVGSVLSSLKFAGNSGGGCVSTWTLGQVTGAGNRLTGTNAGGVQLGAPTGGDCGGGCFNVQGDIKLNNVSQVHLTGTTGSIGGGALTAGNCTSGTVAVTNSTTSMAVVATPATYPGDGAYWLGYVSSAGTVTVKVCVAVNLTPTASTYNVRVLQ